MRSAIVDNGSGLYVPEHLVPAHRMGVPSGLHGEWKGHVWVNPRLEELARLAERLRARGSGQFWVEQLVSAQGDGSSLSNSTTATTIIPAPAKITLPNNFWQYVGKTMRIFASGRLSNIVTTPGTLTLDVRLGGTVVLNGGAMQMSTTAHTTLPWVWEAWLTCRAIGGTGNFMGQARMTGQPISFTNNADLSTSNSIGATLAPNTTPAVGNNVDTTTALSLDLFAAFSIANAGNLIQLHQYTVEVLN